MNSPPRRRTGSNGTIAMLRAPNAVYGSCRLRGKEVMGCAYHASNSGEPHRQYRGHIGPRLLTVTKTSAGAGTMTQRYEPSRARTIVTIRNSYSYCPGGEFEPAG